MCLILFGMLDTRVRCQLGLHILCSAHDDVRIDVSGPLWEDPDIRVACQPWLRTRGTLAQDDANIDVPDLRWEDPDTRVGCWP